MRRVGRRVSPRRRIGDAPGRAAWLTGTGRRLGYERTGNAGDRTTRTKGQRDDRRPARRKAPEGERSECPASGYKPWLSSRGVRVAYQPGGEVESFQSRTWSVLRANSAQMRI